MASHYRSFTANDLINGVLDVNHELNVPHPVVIVYDCLNNVMGVHQSYYTGRISDIRHVDNNNLKVFFENAFDLMPPETEYFIRVLS